MAEGTRKIFTSKDGKKYVWDGTDFREIPKGQEGQTALESFARTATGPITDVATGMMQFTDPEKAAELQQLNQEQQQAARMLRPGLGGAGTAVGEIALAAPGALAGGPITAATLEALTQGARYGTPGERAIRAGLGGAGAAAPYLGAMALSPLAQAAQRGLHALRGSAGARMPAAVSNIFEGAATNTRARMAEFGLRKPNLGTGERMNASTFTSAELQKLMPEGVEVPPAIQAMLDQRAVGADDLDINQMLYQFHASAGSPGFNKFMAGMEGALDDAVRKALDMPKTAGTGQGQIAARRSEIGRKIGEIEESVEWTGLDRPQDVVVTPNEQNIWRSAMDQVGGSTRGGVPDAKRVMDKLRQLADRERPGTEVHDALIKLMDTVQDQIEAKIKDTGKLKEWKKLRKQYAIASAFVDRNVNKGGGFNLASLSNAIRKRYKNFEFDRNQSDLDKIIRTMEAVNRSSIKGSNTADKAARMTATALGLGTVAGAI